MTGGVSQKPRCYVAIYLSLTADKGATLVVLDKTEYTNKAQELLEDGETYKEIKTHPTTKY